MNLTPSIPRSLKGEGEVIEEGLRLSLTRLIHQRAK